MTMQELSAILKDAGVVGAGGAGFPSYAKLNDKADTIILNCAECEPLRIIRMQSKRQRRQLKEKTVFQSVFFRKSILPAMRL